ncbi:MAG: hypothetical protein WAV90_02440 [Gordonia amarae]
MWDPAEHTMSLVASCPHGGTVQYWPAPDAALDDVVRRGIRENKAQLVSGLLHWAGGIEVYPVPNRKAVSWWIDKASLVADVTDCTQCASDDGPTLQPLTPDMLANLRRARI